MATTKKVKKQKSKKTVRNTETQYEKSVGKLSTIIKVKNRERIINCVIGCAGTGKTVENKNIIERYIKKYPKDRVLIVDFNSEYNEYPEITIDEIESFKKPSRIRLHNTNIDRRGRLLMDIGFKFTGGLLVIEDFNATVHHFDYKSIQFIATIINCRTRNIDVIISFQSIQSIPEKLKQNTSAYRIHKTLQDPQRNAPTLYYGMPYLEVPFHYANIEAEKSRFAHVYFDALNQLIVGAKNKESLFKACAEYYRQLIDSLAKRVVYGEN
jgi:Cdc6-like AAA superfamily ATPase